MAYVLHEGLGRRDARLAAAQGGMTAHRVDVLVGSVVRPQPLALALWQASISAFFSSCARISTRRLADRVTQRIIPSIASQ